jgi:hypothetical protein
VARNREIAGLHFPTDTREGADLAARIIDLIWPHPEFQALVENARIEWRGL